ncbi:hypothetical protein DUNSADRAFT_726 [Dunaliella salina]|uniref:Encoded protein n=1 Tax=Dunaliella salina TaxID=3046 RepID=A0ABQ7GXW1_DUNSA|nr:hypothetical protein DUNSADRAFT_726 [Dunaliella salina]|eukprot:KAF5839441.1 hypothetical protein DUNSADRAFT_726 [Dunaliella salina]
MGAKQRLEAVVDQRFDEAVAQRDAASATRFARLYKPLGKKNEGLRRFIQLNMMMRIDIRAPTRPAKTVP